MSGADFGFGSAITVKSSGWVGYGNYGYGLGLGWVGFFRAECNSNPELHIQLYKMQRFPYVASGALISDKTSVTQNAQLQR